MGQLEVVDGRLDLASVGSLSRQELLNWMALRLHGQDRQVPGDVRQGNMPHYLFTQIYPQLDRYSRQDMDSILLEFVCDMARNPQTTWYADAAHELLLLLQSLRVDDALNYIWEMAEDRRYCTSLPVRRSEDLHYRLLQTLVAFGWRGEPEFWQEQANISPDHYAGATFDGLALISPEHALNLLTQIPWTDQVEDQILISLPTLLEQYRSLVMLPLLEYYLPKMTPEAQTSLRMLLNDEGITVRNLALTSFNLGSVRDVLQGLGYDAQPRPKLCASLL